uniref:Uncharacterized protein n=1 Tax=Anguilla anguilla TaxID=7936 RepID=A0A0E9UPP5_ANGAN
MAWPSALASPSLWSFSRHSCEWAYSFLFFPLLPAAHVIQHLKVVYEK